MSRVPDHVTPGAELPPLTVPLTRGFIVASAIASRDYQDVHQDPDAARHSGTKDVFMNILTSNALVERFVRAWAGPGAELRGLRIRLGVPNQAGDVMVLLGTVAEVGDAQAVVDVRAENSLGAHLTGSATLAWPDRDPERGVDQ
ncbi:acyl dehydratase [Dactylosporangium sp. NPDC051484]|uniref:acyl dehydratase n=1 Tax=Dactylosporangium sp. NPDC051484 TaxID=3154942 RepID=UPI00344C1579